MRPIKLLGLATILLCLFAAPVAAQTYPPGGGGPGGCSLAMSRGVVPAGDTETVSTQNCTTAYAPGAAVSHTFESTPVDVGTATADANGLHTHTFTVPADAEAGTHTVRATGVASDGSTLVLSATVTVTRGGVAAGAPRTLAFTGSSNTAALLWIALAALVLGAALVIGARRRVTARGREVGSR